ncbi:MAG: extracellular solute-binding protein [Chloroflexota bacterium]
MKRFPAIAFVAALILSSCGTPTSTNETRVPTQLGGKTPEPAQTVEGVSRIEVQADALRGIEIDVWHPWFDVEESLFNSMVEDFNRTNPYGIKVISSAQINFGNLYENVTQALPREERPDLAIALPEHAQGWDAEGVVADMSIYVQDPVYGFDPADFPSAFWEQDHAGDRRAAFPAQRTAQFLLWNKSWAGELGFDSLPALAEDFRQQACRAHQSMRSDSAAENDAMGGWVLDMEPMTAYSWLLAFDGGVLEGDNYRILTPNNIKAFQFLKKLAEDGCAWQTSGDPLDAFVHRQALFVTASLEDLPEIARSLAAVQNSDEWSVMPFPGETASAFVIYGSSYVILSATPEEELASWIFVRWMLEPAQDARRVQATHLFPLRTSTMDLLADYQASHPHWAEAVNLLDEGDLQPQLGSWRTVKIMLGDGFTDMFTRPDVSSGQVAKVLQQMQDIARELNQ